VLPTGLAGNPTEGCSPDPAHSGDDEGAEWRQYEWSIEVPAPERAGVIGCVRGNLARERFLLPIEELQDAFRRMDEPFAILHRYGVSLTSGKNCLPMHSALVDPWNSTERPELGDSSSVESLRGRVLASGRSASSEDRDAIRVYVGAHHREALQSAPRRSAPSRGPDS
jgi:hypothetical protein